MILVVIAIMICLPVAAAILFVAVETVCNANSRAHTKRDCVMAEIYIEKERCLKLMKEHDELKKQQNEYSRVQYSGELLPTRQNRRR